MGWAQVGLGTNGVSTNGVGTSGVGHKWCGHKRGWAHMGWAEVWLRTNGVGHKWGLGINGVWAQIYYYDYYYNMNNEVDYADI